MTWLIVALLVWCAWQDYCIWKLQQAVIKLALAVRAELSELSEDKAGTTDG